MKKNIKWMLTILIFLFLIFLNFIPNQSLGKEITNFENGGGQPSLEVELLGEPGQCSDSTTYFTIPVHKGKIQEASLKITTMPNQHGEYLLDPKLDVGVDGDIEWQFKGNGYGSFGHQNKFSTDMDRRLISISKTKLKNSIELYLPEGAFVTDASLKLTGGNLKYGEIYFAVVQSNGDIYYIKSNNDKTFSSPEYIGSVGSNSYGIGIGDFDNDNDYDIVVNQGFWTSSIGNIYLFKKNGQGNNFTQLSKPVGYTTSYRNSGFAVGDFDNDKILDFILPEMTTSAKVYFFKGNGTNTFTRYTTIGSYSKGTPYELDAVDFNLDGNLDMVFGSSTAKKVYVYEGKGDGTFVSSPIEVITYTPSSTWTYGAECVIGADFNDDGNPDIISKEYIWNDDNFRFVKGNGDFTFEDEEPKRLTNVIGDDWNPRADSFDFNFDGYQDIITYDNSGSTGALKCYWGSGNGNFLSTPTPIGNIGSGIEGIAAPPTVLLGGCDNLEVDIGSDGGLPDFTFNGSIDNTELLAGANFKNKLNSILSDPPENLQKITDEYGNRLIKIPIEFKADQMGNILLENLSISYTYTTNVDVNPHNENLVNELNDLIPNSGKGEYRVYFNLLSDNPGKAKLSDLYIKFNEAPIFKTIPDLEINEGTDNKNLLDLALYFNDDEELPEELKYSVIYYTQKENLKVSINNGHWLHVNATGDPDWNGEVNVMVSAEDTGNGITRSNMFSITVKPINDQPRLGRYINNIDLLVNSISEEIDLDSKSKRYFYDVDSEALYFKVILFDEQNTGEFEDYIKINLDNETNVLSISSLNDPKIGIPIRIFCSDNKKIEDMKFEQLINYPVYQNILVNITKFGQEREISYSPVWKNIKDIKIQEDDSKMNWLNLNNYTTDLDDPIEKITFTVETVTNSAFMNVFISTSKDNTKNILNIAPEPDFDGESEVTLKAEDKDHNFALEKFRIIMEPKPDIPKIRILSPADESTVSGLITITGSASDAEGELKSIEVKIGTEAWEPVDGLEYWSLLWDSKKSITTTSERVVIKARAFDGEESYSIYDSITLNIENIESDTDSDSVPDIYDSCPTDPLNWIDTDGDGIGDNTDKFKTDPSQWFDEDEDGYGDNPYGSKPDMFPLDPTQWIDLDGDGYGDNLEGNNPDLFPKDPLNRDDEEDTKETASIFSFENSPIFIVIFLIVIDLLIFNYYIIIKKRIKIVTQKNDQLKDE